MKGLENYKLQQQTYKETPSDRAWQRLDNKLQLRNNKRSARRWGWLAVAASTIAILSIWSIYQHQIHEHNPDLYAYNAYNEDSRPQIIEELSKVSEVGIYQIDRLQGLNNAYYGQSTSVDNDD